MCGIAGSIASANESLSSISDRLSWINRRGPDDSGNYVAEIGGYQISLVHSRLSIIDLSNRARQPMESDESNWIVTYNGEIYNYIEVREELIGLGWCFSTESDTEVLLKAWSQWGLDALPKLNGMFAFAIFNKLTSELWLIRDRFGVKPLVWGGGKNSLIFSSSVADIADAVGAKVNESYCAFGLHYKVFEGVNNGTPFDGVNSIPAGGWLKVELGQDKEDKIKVSEGCWYDLKAAVNSRLESIRMLGDDDLLSHCKDVLNSSISIRLRSDAPLAVSLSGGLDSSTIAALAARNINNLCGYTYGSPDVRDSEGSVVARFAEQIGIKPHYIWPTLDASGLDNLLERTLVFQEAPFPGLSVMAQNEVFSAVSQSGYKVLLGGQGGDEIFAGYRKFFVLALRKAIQSREPWDSLYFLYSFGRMLLAEVGAVKTYWQALNRYSERGNKTFKLLNWPVANANLWGAAGISLVDRQIEDLQRWSIPTLLRYEDRNSMGHGVESRLPFMDYRLVELALALPVRLKISNGFGKWALRRITNKIVPDFIRLNRMKRGFDVTQRWIKDGLGERLRMRIIDNHEGLRPYLRAGLNYNELLSDDALEMNSNLLDEALMLAWLVQPVRRP